MYSEAIRTVTRLTVVYFVAQVLLELVIETYLVRSSKINDPLH